MSYALPRTLSATLMELLLVILTSIAFAVALLLGYKIGEWFSKMSFRDRLDILIVKLAIWSLKNSYGANCSTKDKDDFKDLPEFPRCPSCEAKEIITWLEAHIKLIKGE